MTTALGKQIPGRTGAGPRPRAQSGSLDRQPFERGRGGDRGRRTRRSGRHRRWRRSLRSGRTRRMVPTMNKAEHSISTQSAPAAAQVPRPGSGLSWPRKKRMADRGDRADTKSEDPTPVARRSCPNNCHIPGSFIWLCVEAQGSIGAVSASLWSHRIWSAPAGRDG